MNFRQYLAEKKLSDYHAVFIGRMNPLTIGHKSVVDDLLKNKFKSVNIALSPSGGNEKNPLTPQQREAQIKDVYGKKVNAKPVETFKIFGLYLQEHIDEVKKIFGIKDDLPIVIVVGMEDDRYGSMSKRGKYFDATKGELPSEEKPTGLFGQQLKVKSGGGKVSATDVRNAVKDGDLDTAMKYLAGSDKTKKQVIKQIQDTL